LPGAPDYESARKPTMARFENTRPAAAALCSTPRMSPRRSGSRRTHLQTAIRSGGIRLSAGPRPQGSSSRSPHGLGQAGDRIHRHGPPPPGPKVAGLADDQDDLRGAGGGEPATVTAMRFAAHSAVGAVAGSVQRPTVVGLLDILTRNSAASRWVCRASAVLLHTTRPYLTNRTYRENAGALGDVVGRARAHWQRGSWWARWLGRREALPGASLRGQPPPAPPAPGQARR
jgi:hypothetical protein